MVAIAATPAYLFWRYPALPDILPVHFGPKGGPNRWQFRTIPRVFVPVFVQLGIFLAGTALGVLYVGWLSAHFVSLRLSFSPSLRPPRLRGLFSLNGGASVLRG